MLEISTECLLDTAENEPSEVLKIHGSYIVAGGFSSSISSSSIVCWSLHRATVLMRRNRPVLRRRNGPRPDRRRRSDPAELPRPVGRSAVPVPYGYGRPPRIAFLQNFVSQSGAVHRCVNLVEFDPTKCFDKMLLSRLAPGLGPNAG